MFYFQWYFKNNLILLKKFVCLVIYITFRNLEEAITMMMKMMNYFCGMVDQRKGYSLISVRDHYQKSSPSWISDPARARFQPSQNLSSGFVEWRCTVMIITTPWLFNSSNSKLVRIILFTDHLSLSAIHLLLIVKSKLSKFNFVFSPTF